jgi:hypothetical protein
VDRRDARLLHLVSDSIKTREATHGLLVSYTGRITSAPLLGCSLETWATASSRLNGSQSSRLICPPEHRRTRSSRRYFLSFTVSRHNPYRDVHDDRLGKGADLTESNPQCVSWARGSSYSGGVSSSALAVSGGCATNQNKAAVGE